MLEFKVLKTTVLGEPKLAIVIGWCIQAEPDAKRGFWTGSRGLDDIFLICKSQDYAVLEISRLNKGEPILMDVDPLITNYLKSK